MTGAPVWNYRENILHCEEASLADLASRHGTPAYVYSRRGVEEACKAFLAAFSALDPQVNFAVKANSNLAILSVVAKCGFGFDVVSLGELLKVELAGGDLGKVVFSGVGKGREEIERALEKGIQFFCAESGSELDCLLDVGRAHGVRVPLAVRVNPDVDAKTHPHIATGMRANKFGVMADDAVEMARRIAESGEGDLVAVSCHIGSQIFSVGAMQEAAGSVARIAQTLRDEGAELRFINMGGGFGVDYAEPSGSIDLDACSDIYRQAFQREGFAPRLMLEPGRLLVARAGALLTRVRYVKQGAERLFAVVDAAMNDLIRPALYGAEHRVLKVAEPQPVDGVSVDQKVDIVGPVCESADFLAKGVDMSVREGELLSVQDVGAYAMAMASNYNERPRPCEIMVDGDKDRVVRERETYEQMFAPEIKNMPPAP